MLTFALIVIIIALFASFFDSSKALQKRQKRNKVTHLTTANLALQEEIYLKWFDTISEEIENDKLNDKHFSEGGEPMSTSGLISRCYLRHNIPHLDASRQPDRDSKTNGNKLMGRAHSAGEFNILIDPTKSILYYDDTLPKLDSVSIYMMMGTSYGDAPFFSGYGYVDDYPSNTEGNSILNSKRDWRLWLADPSLLPLGGTDAWRRDKRVIKYILFKDQIDDMYKRYNDAGLIITRSECNEEICRCLGTGRWRVFKSSDRKGENEKVVFSICADGDDDYAKAAKKIYDSFKPRSFTRMETILCNDDLRIYLINLLCLLTKRELAENGYGYSLYWNGSCYPHYLYEPTDEEVKEYPWFYQS